MLARPPPQTSIKIRSKAERPQMRGRVFWLFGLSGAGKSTLGQALAQHLRSDGRPVLLLDGDRVRAGLCTDLQFSDEDRTENLRRVAEVSRLAIESGIDVVATFITPRAHQRRQIAGIIGRRFIAFVFVNASLAVCRQRDVKGLYARASAGKLRGLTGVSSRFEAPRRSDCELRTDREPAETSLRTLLKFAAARR